MSDNDPLPDYYAILQVHPSAEPEIIEAAYRRLMRKYHPDTLSPESRSDPSLISRVRAINVAYDVLSDPVQRVAYDAAVAHPNPVIAQEIDPNIETRIHLVRCARTKQNYRMLLGRRKETSTLFRVLGFELVDPPFPVLAPTPQIAALPAPAQPTNLLGRLRARFIRHEKDGFDTSSPQPRFPTPATINDLFEENSSLNFAEINFSGWRCLACNGEYTHADGVPYTWCRCSACARIYCAGDIHPTKLGDFTRCPWCSRRARITAHIHPGDSVNMPVKGEIGRSSQADTKRPRLANPDRRSLPDK